MEQSSEVKEAEVLLELDDIDMVFGRVAALRSDVWPMNTPTKMACSLLSSAFEVIDRGTLPEKYKKIDDRRKWDSSE